MAEFDPDKFLAEDNISDSKSFDPDEFLSETTPDVKKKEQTKPTRNAPLPGLGGVSEEPLRSPSVGQALPSTGNNTLDNIYQKYSALRSMGKVTLKADPNFTRDKTGAGSIEYFSPKQDTVRYGTGLKTPHPKLGTHGIVYNPNENTEEDIMLDMLHGMTSDKEYSRLRDKFKEQTISDRGGDIKYFYEKDKKEGRARDGYEQWLDNYVDGLIRSEISTATQGDYALEREGNTPNMKGIASEIDSYLKTGLPRLEKKPTQAAPLEGLGGVSEEPTPSPSVGRGVLRNVGQTQPTGEEFISQASDPTRQPSQTEPTRVSGAGGTFVTKEDAAPIIGYEENQKALSDIDKQISNNQQQGRFIDPTRQKRLKELQAERDILKKRSDQLISETNKDVSGIISKGIGDDWEDFTNELGDIDVSKIGDFARQEALNYGLPEDGYFFERVKNAAKAKVELEKISPTTESFFLGGERRSPEGIVRKKDVQLPGYDSPSTVLMSSYGPYTVDGKHAAFPTLFPKDPKRQTSNPNDWIVAENDDEAYRIAKERGEVLYFDTQKEADAMAEGSWKKIKGTYEEMYGVKPGDDAENMLSREDTRKALGLSKLDAEFSSQMAQLNSDISRSSTEDIERISEERYGQPIDNYVSQLGQGYESESKAIESRYSSLIQDGNFVGSQDQYDAYQQELQSVRSGYESQFNDVVSQNMRDVAAVNNRANRRFNRQRDEILQAYKTEYTDKAKGINPILQERYQKAYNKALDKAMEVENIKKESRAMLRGKLATGSFTGGLGASGIISGASGQMSSIFRSMGMKEGAEFFEQAAINFDIGDTEIKGWKDILDPKKLIKSTSFTLGGMAPMLVASTGVGMVTGGVGGGAMLTTLAAGTAGFGVETMSITQDAYDQKFKETGSVAKAEEAANKSFNGQVMLMPMYALGMAPFFGNIGGKLAKIGMNNAPARFIAGGVMETVSELGQEYPQQLFEQAIADDKELSAAFDYASVEGFKSTVLNVAPTTFLLGGGGAATQKGETSKEDMAKALAMKVNIGELTETAMEQNMLAMTVNAGEKFSKAFVATQLMEGNITEEQAERATSAIESSVATIEKGKEYNLDNKNNYILATLDLKLKAAKAKAESESDPMMKGIAENKVKKIEKQAQQLMETGNVDVALVTYPDGSFDILTHDEARLAMSKDEFMESFSSGDLKVEAMGESQAKLMSELQEKAKAMEPEAAPVEEKPTPRVFETPTDERYAVVNEGKGEGDRVLTRQEYEDYVAPAQEEKTKEDKLSKDKDRNERIEKALAILEPIASAREELTVEQLAEVSEILGEELAGELISDQISKAPDAVDLYNLLDDNKVKIDDTQTTEQEGVGTEEQVGEEGAGQVQEPEVSQEEGAADPVLQEEEEVESTTEEDLDAIDRELSDQGVVEGALTGRSRKRKVVKAVRNGIKAISKALPNVTIKLYETQAEFEEATGKKGNGYYNFKEKSISINLDTANARTVAHEIFHAFLFDKISTNEEAASISAKLFLELNKVEGNNAKLVKELSDFASMYEEEGIGVMTEEMLAEYLGKVAENYDSLSARGKRAVREFVNSMLELIGKANPETKEFLPSRVSGNEVVDMLVGIGERVAAGEVIETEQIEGLFTPEITVEVSEATKATDREQLNPEEVKSKNVKGKKVGKGLSVKQVKGEKVKEGIDNISVKKAREASPNLYIKNANILKDYDVVKGVKKFREIKSLKQADEVYDIFVNEVSENLIYLHDKFNQDLLDYATLWYDGANQIAQEFASKFDISLEQAAGIIAAQSPQKDWYQNVRLAEMVLEQFKSNPVFTQEALDFQKEINERGYEDKSGDKLRKARERGDKLIAALESFVGQNLNDIPDAFKPYVVRTTQEISGSKDYDVISPDGRRVGLAKKNDGSNAKVAWGSYTEIGKSVAIYLNGSEKNISDQLGVMHKIRNFFNNISDPMSEDNDVTMDTHAVAAALLKPLSGKSKQVAQNFGTGTSNSGPLGLKGVYYAFADAYVKAAKEKGILPREMQSITWEAARGLFTDSYKTNKANVKEVNDIFKDYTNGKITKDEAREKVLEAAGGVNDPTWAGPILSELGKDSKKKADTGRLPGDERGGKRSEAKPRDRGRDTGDVSGVTGRDQKIKATIDFKNRYGKYFSISKIFSNEKHLDNYISFMERKGNKEIGTERGVDVPDVSPTQPFAGREQKNAPLFSGKNKNIIDLANKYIAKKGLAAPEDTEIRKLNTEYSKAMADVYEAAKNTPLDEDVQRAYKALAKESKEQFEALKKDGYVVELWDGANQPYDNSTEMVEDLKDNKHLYVFSTEEGFGEKGITAKNRRENPMLADSGYKDANGKKLLLNDLFRFVHDAFGHGKLGNSFGPVGEENAWYVHSQMFSPDARRAMTSETRGQNSWVNFGPQLRDKDGSLPKRGDKNYVPMSQRDFAPQKNFLFPEEYVFDRPNTQGRFEGREQKVKVDKSTIKKNVVAAVDFIKKAALKAEDGVTLNIDGTRYDGGGLVVPISSMNVEQSTLKPSTVADFIEMNKGKLSNDTFKLGLYKFPKESTVSIDLSVIVPNENRKLALSVGKKLNQESLFDLDSGENIKTGGTGQNTVELTDEQAAELAISLLENKEPEFLGRESRSKEKKRGFLDRNIEKLKFASNLSESVFEDPEAFYEPQVLAEIKENAKYMSDSELIEAMSLDGLNSIMNISGSTNTNMAVLAAAELINRKLAEDKDIGSVVLQLNKMGTAVGQLMRQFGELKKSTPAGYMLAIERLAEKNNIKLNDIDKKKISKLLQAKTDLIKDLKETTDKRLDPNLSLDEQKKLDKEVKKISNELYKVDSELNRFVQTKIPLKLTDALIQIMQGNLLTLGSLVVNIVGNITQLGLSLPIKLTASSFDFLRKFIIGGERTTSFSIPAYWYGAKSFVKALPDAARILFWKGPRGDYNEMLKGEINNGLLGIRAWMALMSKGGMPEVANMSEFDRLLSKISKDLGEKKYFAKADIFLSILAQGTFGIPADVMFRALQAGDVIFKRPYRDMSLHEIGKRKGLSGERLERLLKYPSKKELYMAEEIAKEGTFQEDSTLSSLSKEGVDFLSKWASKAPYVGNVLKLLVRSKFPYVKTPANIASFTFKMCVPEVAFAASAVYLSKGDNRKAALNFGIGVTGAMTSMVAAGLVANGLAQSMGDDDEPEVRGMKFAEFPPGTMNRSALSRVLDYIKEGYGKGGASEMGDRFNQFLTGDIPKSVTDVRPGEDEFVSYLKLGMPGFVLGVYAMEERDTVKDRAINAKKDDITKMLFTEAIRLPQSIRFVTQQSFLQGTADLMNLMTLKEDAVRDWSVNTVRTVSSIALPNQLASFARTQRDYIPDYRSDDAWTQIKNVLDDKIFFLRKETPMNQIRVDIWGRSIDQTPEGANRYMYHLGLDPLRKTKPSEDLVNSEILNLAVKTKSSKAYPKFINDVVKSYYKPTGKSEDFILNKDQVNKLQRISGSINYDKVKNLILDGNDNVKLEWEFMDDETKLNKLSKIYSETKEDEEFEDEKKRILTDIVVGLGR
jgi:SHS2 domain-containing protein